MSKRKRKKSTNGSVNIPETYVSMKSIPTTVLTGAGGTTVSRYSKYTKEQVSTYLQSPITYEKQLRDASIYMYANSMQYHNLIDHVAFMPVWRYTLVPLKFDRRNVKEDALYKQYVKVQEKVQIMNIPHEFQKIMRVCWREDVFYGVCIETKDSFFIFRLNPDYCKISSIEDGVYNFAFDFSQITEQTLPLYPEMFEPMWNAYQNDPSLRWQEIPADVGVCIKVNEDLTYPFPPFAPSMPLLYDIEDYRDLIKQRTEIGNYKALAGQIPLDEKGSTLISNDITQRYFRQMENAVPDGIGIILSPFKMTDHNFDKTGLMDTNEVAKSEESFWSSTGVSSLLFSSVNKASVTALKLSIKATEEIVLALMRQLERWLNRKIKMIAGTIKFKANILPLTQFNIEDYANMYKEACLYGIPAKTAYSACMDMEPGDVSAMAYLENTLLGYPEDFIPLRSSYTQSSETIDVDEGGRPTNESKGEDLTEAGEQTLNDDENAAREV